MIARSRTQVRREKRKHTVACYRAGALQRIQHVQEVENFRELSASDKGTTLLASVVVNKSDCQALKVPVHHAPVANFLTRANGMPSSAEQLLCNIVFCTGWLMQLSMNM